MGTTYTDPPPPGSLHAKTHENSRLSPKVSVTRKILRNSQTRKNSQKLAKTRDISRKLAKTQQTPSKHRENSPKSINLAITHKYSRTAVKSRQISTHLAWPRLARTRQNSPTLVHTRTHSTHSHTFSHAYPSSSPADTSSSSSSCLGCSLLTLVFQRRTPSYRRAPP